jgi:hypothetical protein
MITTKTAYISVLNSEKKELTIGGNVTVAGYGGGGANYKSDKAMKVDGWEVHTSGSVSSEHVEITMQPLIWCRTKKGLYSFLLIVMRKGKYGE